MFVLFLALGTGNMRAETTNALSDAEIQGRKLAQQLLEQSPAENFTNTGVLKIRDGKGKTTEVPIHFETFVTTTNWTSVYELSPPNVLTFKKLVVVHDSASSNQYRLTFNFGGDPDKHWIKDNSDIIKMLSFAGDFGCADLGLEFFHWPQQKVLPKTTPLSRGRSYTLLESTNPNPSTNGYSRVLSWIDKETGGILEAEAYDARGKLLKVFEPKSFKKVNGQWELQEMEIRNVQTGSRTRLEFDLNKK
ncbi:MAG: outer membrane lipoprotein-sorting protein [Verrucomicrobiales bacterium]|nr:outer membrane lipoprotein-sorting protein [Verrucomicrobiales bacterium]